MGKIKKILEKELGSTQSVEVYPVTSIEAVYDENNERLDNIINRKNNETQKELKAEVARATNAESNLRETINNITEINEKATSANIVTIDTIPNTSSSNVQQALNELFKNATFAGIATPATNPGAPDGSVFYFANQEGTYTNFNGIKLSLGESSILKYSNGVWNKILFPALDAYEDSDSAKMEDAHTYVLTHNGNAIKPMTGFDAVVNDKNQTLKEVTQTLNSRIGEFNESEEGTLYEQVQEAKNSGGGLSADAISMLVAILNSAVYVSNQSAAIEELRTELKKGGGSSSGVSRPQIVENYETYLVSITCEDGDAVNIYYTIDGSTPTSSSTLYSGEFSNREDCTIKAIAINKITGKKSTVVTFMYIAKTIDYIEFADPVIEAALLASTNPKIDTNSDGKIQKTEAAAATRLPNFSANNNIISFDELEYFTGITTTPMFYSCKNFASVKLPKNGALTSIRDSFVNSCAITSIDIPEGVTSIGDSAFQNCPLRNVTLPSTLTTIVGGSFKGTLITEITIPDSVTTIGGASFNSCRQLSEIHIGEGVTSIGDVAFYAGYNGRRIYLPSTPPTLEGNSVFIGGGMTTFYVKSQEIKDAYMAIEAWSKYGESNFVIEP